MLLDIFSLYRLGIVQDVSLAISARMLLEYRCFREKAEGLTSEEQ